MKKAGLIVKSNQVIEAGYELSTSEQRLILSAIEQIPKVIPVSSNEIYQINAKDFVRLFGVHEKTAYRDLKEAAAKLYDRSITIKTKETTTKIRWLQMLQVKNPYFHDTLRGEDWNSVLLVFSEAVTPLLSDLKSEFTKYLASDLKGLSSAYAIRIYELIKQYENIGKREIAISDLRFMLCLQDKYPLFGNLQQRIIDPAIREINKNTPMQVTYELRKTGRKFTHIELRFKPKKENKAISTVSNRDPNTVDLIAKMTDKQRFSFAKKLSDMPEMSKYSHGTESYEQFAIRIAEMLLDPEKRKELAPYLVKVGFSEKP